MWRAWLLILALPASAAGASSDLDQVFRSLYNFDFPAAQTALDQRIAAHPDDPLPYAVRAAAYLFYELDRLQILESEFFADDKRIIEKKKLKPDPDIRAKLFDAIAAVQKRAETALSRDPNDTEALFSMCVVNGVTSDYTALVEKRQMRSLPSVKRSNNYAQRLLKIDPKFYDAYLTTGISEYLLGSLPFLIRWFFRMDGVQGSKDQAIRNLELVAREGHYLGPFARILLGIIYLREKQPREAQRLLAGLSRDFPSNPLFRKELDKVAAQVGPAQ